MSILARIFTWWNGATIGTLLWSRRVGTRVGADALGNVYFEGGRDVHGQPRRWVIYQGSNDASRVPPEWHGWLHHTIDLVPEALPPARRWEDGAVAEPHRHPVRLPPGRRAGARRRPRCRHRGLRSLDS